jgi:hypothetical protein
MKLYAIVAIGVGTAGCSGAPFELRSLAGDAGALDEAPPRDLDAGTPEAATQDASYGATRDVASSNDTVDADNVDAAAPEAGLPQNPDARLDGPSDAPTAFDAPVCTPFPADAACNGYRIPKFVFTSVCGIIANTPLECTCRETYNCACFAQHAIAICGTTATLQCSDTNPPAVLCQ